MIAHHARGDLRSPGSAGGYAMALGGSGIHSGRAHAVPNTEPRIRSTSHVIRGAPDWSVRTSMRWDTRLSIGFCRRP